MLSDVFFNKPLFTLNRNWWETFRVCLSFDWQVIKKFCKLIIINILLLATVVCILFYCIVFCLNFNKCWQLFYWNFQHGNVLMFDSCLLNFYTH